LQIEFVYLIRTSGIEADDILRGMEITLGGDLIIATTILVKNILQEDPAGGDRRMQNKRVRGKASLVKTTVASGQDSVPYHGLKSTKKNDSGRYLASYYKDSPVILNDVFDSVCSSPPASDEDERCVLISSIVTVFLDPGEDPEEVRLLIVTGLRQAFLDGSFVEAIP